MEFNSNSRDWFQLTEIDSEIDRSRHEEKYISKAFLIKRLTDGILETLPYIYNTGPSSLYYFQSIRFHPVLELSK